MVQNIYPQKITSRPKIQQMNISSVICIWLLEKKNSEVAHATPCWTAAKQWIMKSNY